MKRIFTRDVGRWENGEAKDYPMPTWRGIAASMMLTIDDFSRSETDLTIRRGPGRPRKEATNASR